MVVGDAIRTVYETYVQRLLDFLEIPYDINHILCFICNDHFYWASSSLPEHCSLGLHKMLKGEFARPDVILKNKKTPMPIQTHTKGYEANAISVLRIDGEVHDKRIQTKKDKVQEHMLKELNIPFFVTRNEFWKWEDIRTGKMFVPDPWRIEYKKIPVRHLDYLISIYTQTLNNSLYQKYQGIKEVKDSKLI